MPSDLKTTHNVRSKPGNNSRSLLPPPIQLARTSFVSHYNHPRGMFSRFTKGFLAIVVALVRIRPLFSPNCTPSNSEIATNPLSTYFHLQLSISLHLITRNHTLNYNCITSFCSHHWCSCIHRLVPISTLGQATCSVMEASNGIYTDYLPQNSRAFQGLL